MGSSEKWPDGNSALATHPDNIHTGTVKFRQWRSFTSVNGGTDETTNTLEIGISGWIVGQDHNDLPAMVESTYNRNNKAFRFF